MQLEDDEEVSRTVAVDKLPCEFHVDGFADEYALHLEIHNSAPASVGALICCAILLIVGALIALLGGLTIVFGPRTVTYNALTGPSLLQFIQLVPGPIFTVGGLMVGVAAFIDNHNGKPPFAPEVYLLLFYELQFAEMPDDPSRISLEYLNDGKFRISLSCT